MAHRSGVHTVHHALLVLVLFLLSPRARLLVLVLVLALLVIVCSFARLLFCSLAFDHN